MIFGKHKQPLHAAERGELRRSTLSGCRSTRISASNAVRDRNSGIDAHQLNLQISLIDGTINRFASVSQLLGFAVGQRHAQGVFIMKRMILAAGLFAAPATEMRG